MNTKWIITMYKKYIYTCYGCPHFYADKGDRYRSRHCEIIDIWKCWEDEKEYLRREQKNDMCN